MMLIIFFNKFVFVVFVGDYIVGSGLVVVVVCWINGLLSFISWLIVLVLIYWIVIGY